MAKIRLIGIISTVLIFVVSLIILKENAGNKEIETVQRS